MVDGGRRGAVTWAFFLLLVSIYFILLIPYVVHTNLSHSGLVISSEEVSIESLPEGIRIFIVFRDKPVVAVIKQQKPVWVNRPVTEWTIALITAKKPPSGAFIEFIYPVAQMYVDWRDYPLGQVFDQLVIADVVREIPQFEADVEQLLSSPYGAAISALSTVDYYFGPFLFVLMAYVFERRPTIWSIVMIPWCYSAETFIYNTLAIRHYNYIPDELKLFGYLFIILTPMALLAWAYERTPRGRAVIKELFTLRKR